MGKRKYRQASEATKNKMRLSHLNKRHSQKTKDSISKSLIKYWKTVPDDPVSNR